VKEGEEVTFTCKVSGEPHPEVTWSLRGQRLTPSDRCIITDNVDQQTYSLKLLEVSPEDVAMIEVTASNPSGQVTCSANLDVQGRLSFWKLWKHRFISPQQPKAGSCSASVSCLFSVFIYCSDFCHTNFISTPTEPIFTKFAGLVELWLWVNDLKLVFWSPLPWQPVLWALFTEFSSSHAIEFLSFGDNQKVAVNTREK